MRFPTLVQAGMLSIAAAAAVQSSTNNAESSTVSIIPEATLPVPNLSQPSQEVPIPPGSTKNGTAPALSIEVASELTSNSNSTSPSTLRAAGAAAHRFSTTFYHSWNYEGNSMTFWSDRTTLCNPIEYRTTFNLIPYACSAVVSMDGCTLFFYRDGKCDSYLKDFGDKGWWYSNAAISPLANDWACAHSFKAICS